ncbi:MAG: homocysteine S-methyltransferase family protein [Planctomycetota bacterium]
MTKTDLAERISWGIFILDGAMGTQLIERGVPAGICSDELNLNSPNIVSQIHKAYFDAGSNAVITNTFGANRFALQRHGLSEKVQQINTAGAEIARKAAGPDRYVLGDIGPTGDFLEPVGTLKAEDMKAAFAQQAGALSAGGVDGFIVETMTDLNEAVAAVQAIRSVSDLPIFVSFSFDAVGDDFKTMMGLDVKSAVEKISSLPVQAAGFNCGTATMAQYVELTKRFVAAVPPNIALLAEPNAGKPQLVNSRTVYRLSAGDFADSARQIHALGVKIIGGCCGTGPAHIQAVAKMLKQ